MTATTTLRGRFAPSPTGPLHFGSLVAALASWLQARQQRGEWLLRMEDIDPPREMPGAADDILQTLVLHGLQWDGPVLYQHTRYPAYDAVLSTLQSRGLLYRCNCSRERLRTLDGRYDGHCKRHPPAVDAVTAWRVITDPSLSGIPTAVSFIDLIQGPQQADIAVEGDFVLFRRDGFHAYQLAVVADDLAQGITHVIRGADILDSTPRQIWLMRLLGHEPPVYGHVPVAVNADGQKLSKQNLARALNPSHAGQNLLTALQFLGQHPPSTLAGAPVPDILSWALANSMLSAIPATTTLPAPLER